MRSTRKSRYPVLTCNPAPGVSCSPGSATQHAQSCIAQSALPRLHAREHRHRVIRVAASDSRVASNAASLSSRRWRTAHGLLYVVARRCTPADASARFLKAKLLKRVGRHKDRRASLVFTCIACQEALDRFVARVVSLSRTTACSVWRAGDIGDSGAYSVTSTRRRKRAVHRLPQSSGGVIKRTSSGQTCVASLQCLGHRRAESIQCEVAVCHFGCGRRGRHPGPTTERLRRHAWHRTAG